MWSISQPHCSVFPYLVRCMLALQASLRKLGYAGSGFPFCQTASIVLSSKPPPLVVVFGCRVITLHLLSFGRLARPCTQSTPCSPTCQHNPEKKGAYSTRFVNQPG